MYYTGFADEVSPNIDRQIAATKALGWSNIESRVANGANIHDISNEEFDIVYGKLQDAGVSVNCFGTTIANWAKQIDAAEDTSFEELDRAIPRMKRLGTKLMRVMSYAIRRDENGEVLEDQMEEERFSRLRRITESLLAEGIQPVHENCMNYGGMSYSHTLKLLDNVPGLKLVFDTGNPIFNNDYSKEGYPKQDAFEFYENVKEHIAYVHIKDGQFTDKMNYSLPGKGDGYVAKILADLFANGYDGGLSIEPHLGVVFHDDSDERDMDYCYNAYIEYGQTLETIVNKIKSV